MSVSVLHMHVTLSTKQTPCMIELLNLKVLACPSHWINKTNRLEKFSCIMEKDTHKAVRSNPNLHTSYSNGCWCTFGTAAWSCAEYVSKSPWYLALYRPQLVSLRRAADTQDNGVWANCLQTDFQLWQCFHVHAERIFVRWWIPLALQRENCERDSSGISCKLLKLQ